MLAPLAAYLAIMLILCASYLLTCWAYENVGHPTKVSGSDLAESKFAVNHRSRRSPGRPSASRLPKVSRPRPQPPRLGRSSSLLIWHSHLRRPSWGR